ncbi:cilia- and flagella-associated protein 53 isoform X1 [Falco rusticolus]|uniref:cilia- and flagella-associated protein 53 isoform X1 n=1 Tax=Falco rusticolus TaxID=120794 RepID=UPI0018869F92|nr:cilia- and flagella-associated protein 53 isoform X1 [Falco rusticolus]XP_055554306.1 cilia- and flagella-associated protein 53 isoform X1 [Falco cherrug]
MEARRRRCREVTGPVPHSLALRAKPPKDQRSDNFFLAQRQKEKELPENADFLKLYNQCRNVCEWQQCNEQKWLHSIVQRKVDATMQEYLAGIDGRRERLRELLEAEESRYFAEMEALGETVQEKQAKMREQAKLLREKREKERQQVVAEKREQQFREQCEELRVHWMKKHQKELCADQLAQLALKEELKKQQKKKEQMFAELWKEDRLAQEKQEAVKMQKSVEQNRQILNALSAQVAVLSARKEEEKRLKEEESRLLEEQQQLLKLENEQLQMEKLQKQKECRDALLSAARDKKNHLSELKQGELALELKILEKSLQEPQEDAEEKTKRKQELLKEQQTYLAHLAQQQEEEKQREKEVDKLLDEEMAKVWARKAEQMRLEKEARKQLLKDVLNTRQLQIEEKLQRNAKEQQELVQERKLLAEAVAELKHTEKERHARKVKEAKEYQEQLMAQIAYRQQAHDAEEEEKQREYELGLSAERAYQERIQDILSRPCEKLANTHPLRRKLTSNS